MRRSFLIVGVALAIAAPAAAQSLTGAGATFPNPIYTKWFDAYSKKTGVQINYQSIGSGGGIRQFTEGTVDFGATDGPMNESQIQSLSGNVLHLPTVLGAVVVTYNLPSLGETKLKFDGNVLVEIFLGRVTKWNDPKIAALNPGVKLPNNDLIVVHRSDGSGTTYVFTDFLNKFSREWKDKVGYATSVNWPVGLGGKGNEGVTQQVKQVEGALGYVELIYAISNDLPYAEIKNASGNYINPSEFPFKERRHASFQIGRLSRPAPEKFPEDFPVFYEALDLPDTRFRVMAWNDEMARKYRWHRFDGRWDLIPAETESQVSFLHSLDLFVYPLGHAFLESWGRSTVEAMLTGCIPLVPPGHHLDHLVEPGKSGFICGDFLEYREHARRLCLDYPYRRRMSRQCRAHACATLCNRRDHIRMWREALA